MVVASGDATTDGVLVHRLQGGVEEGAFLGQLAT
jgi:hypothetical protein